MRLAIGLAGAAVTAGAVCGEPSLGERPAGEALYRLHCYACHAIEPGRSTPAGPTLHAIVGRPIAGVADFNYSPALQRLAARHPRWSRQRLDQFLADPQAVAPGTEMGFPGLADPRQRRALIDWLAARQAHRS